MLRETPLYLRLNPADDVVIACRELEAGTNLLLLFVGCFLEPTAAITLLVPILIPICLKLGIDPVHFGLVMVLNLMIGLLHLPMGTVLFVLSRVAKLSFERTTIAILPWLVPLFATLILCTYVPEIVLWLPRKFF